jgi:hypothetical protein
MGPVGGKLANLHLPCLGEHRSVEGGDAGVDDAPVADEDKAQRAAGILEANSRHGLPVRPSFEETLKNKRQVILEVINVA